MKEKSKKMKPFAFISIMFSLLLVVSVGYFWIGKSADKSRADDAVGVKSVRWTDLPAQAPWTWYNAKPELCRDASNLDSKGQYKSWNNCKSTDYGWSGSFDFEKNSDWKTGDFYIHVKVEDGRGRHAIPSKYHYDPNGSDLILDSYGLILTGDMQTYICDQYQRGPDGDEIDCDHDYLPTL